MADDTGRDARCIRPHLKLRDKLTWVQPLVADDLLPMPLFEWERLSMHEVVKGRGHASATSTASQYRVRERCPAIGDPTVANALCDLLAHDACRLELRGDSMRHHREPAFRDT